MAGAGACPSCRRPVAKRDRICTGCGWDLVRGKKQRTELKPPKVKSVVGDRMLAAMIVLVGSVVEVVLFAAARESAAGIRMFREAVAVGLVLIVGLLAVTGFREDGAMGAMYRVANPLGTLRAGDDDAPWSWFAVGWLVVLACLLMAAPIAR